MMAGLRNKTRWTSALLPVPSKQILEIENPRLVRFVENGEGAANFLIQFPLPCRNIAKLGLGN